MSNGEEAGRGQARTDTAWAAVQQVVKEADQEHFDAVLDALKRKYTDLRQITKALKEALPEELEKNAQYVVPAAVGFMAGWMNAGRPKGIEKRISNRTFDETPDANQKARVVALFMSPAFQLAAGALNAQQVRGLSVGQVQINFDLTPIDWSEDPASALLPGFQLAIDSYDPLDVNREDRHIVHMDIEDIRALKRQADAALERLERVRDAYAKFDVLIWGVDEELEEGEGND